jgi:hypothetical protein
MMENELVKEDFNLDGQAIGPNPKIIYFFIYTSTARICRHILLQSKYEYRMGDVTFS